MAVISLARTRPAPRFDDVAWTTAIVQESIDGLTGWEDRTEFELDPVDTDPTTPARRSFTIVNAESEVGWFRVRYEDIDGNYSLTEPVGLSGYPTTEAIRDASTNVQLLALSDDAADAIRRIAITNIERFCGQRFTYADETVTVDGSGGVELWLPKRLETVTAISLKGTSVDTTDVTISDTGNRIFFAPLSDNYAVQAMREEGAIDSRTFRTGPGVVTITGRWGWSVTPDAVAEALRLEMEAEASGQASALAPIVASARRLGLKTLAQGNLRADIGDPSFVTPESARLLADYVWTGEAGYVV